MAESSRTYKQVQAEIEKLQTEAETLRQQELAGVLADIRAKVAEFGITEQDIFGRKRIVRTPAEPKYQDPKSGATWSGRGKPPSWIAKAKNRDRFLISQ
ncbi:H-NS histone family protein [Burkholderia cenocepacia]|jgi:DNA-binding protein H-NS|uniref:H-NS histone family protein n=1 Tax=Burkholderia cenocepacia TaxID=95486 RepID=UPI000F5C09EC|nr:H-NS histone family protein [Burkholderia cenocepacia]RQU99894.1 H-NS histone family protein [Burkholderia cenocepacia]